MEHVAGGGQDRIGKPGCGMNTTSQHQRETKCNMATPFQNHENLQFKSPQILGWQSVMNLAFAWFFHSTLRSTRFKPILCRFAMPFFLVSFLVPTSITILDSLNCLVRAQLKSNSSVTLHSVLSVASKSMFDSQSQPCQLQTKGEQSWFANLILYFKTPCLPWSWF